MKFDTLKQLKAKGFPQGGAGNFVVDPDTGEKFYKPHPSELYNQFLGDPTQWGELAEAMAQVWLSQRK